MSMHTYVLVEARVSGLLFYNKLYYSLETSLSYRTCVLARLVASKPQ